MFLDEMLEFWRGRSGRHGWPEICEVEHRVSTKMGHTTRGQAACDYRGEHSAVAVSDQHEQLVRTGPDGPLGHGRNNPARRAAAPSPTVRR
jgi:hypothetical protein